MTHDEIDKLSVGPELDKAVCKALGISMEIMGFVREYARGMANVSRHAEYPKVSAGLDDFHQCVLPEIEKRGLQREFCSALREVTKPAADVNEWHELDDFEAWCRRCEWCEVCASAEQKCRAFLRSVSPQENR